MLNRINHFFSNINYFKNSFILANFLYILPYVNLFMAKTMKIFLLWGLFLIINIAINLFKKKENLDFVNIIQLIFILICTLSIIVNYNNHFVRNIISISYLFLQMPLLFFYKDKYEVNDVSKFLNIFNYVFFAFAIISLLLGIFNFHIYRVINSVGLVFGIHDGRLFGLYGNPNCLANIACISIYFSIFLLLNCKKFSNRVFYILNILIQIICLMWSSSRSSIIAFIISIIVVFIIAYVKKNPVFFKKIILKNKSKLYLYISIFLMAIVIIIFCLLNTNLFGRVYHTSDVSNGRFSIWGAAIQVANKNFLFGVGNNNVKDSLIPFLLEYFNNYNDYNLAANTHNIYLQVLVSNGIFALIAFLLVLGSVFSKFLKRDFDIKIMPFFGLTLTICIWNFFDSNMLYMFFPFCAVIFWYSFSILNYGFTSQESKKEKVLFLIDSLGSGGAERVMTDVVNNLDYKKYDIEVITIYNEGKYIKKLSNKIKYNTIIQQPNIWKKRFFSKLVMFCPSEILYLLLFCDKYDTEIAFLEGMSTKIISGSVNLNSKKIAWVHLDMTKHLDIKKWYLNDKNFIKAYGKFDKIVSVCNSARESCIQVTGQINNQYVAYNPLDEKSIKKKSQVKVTIPFTNEQIVLVAIGRLEPTKNFLTLIKCVEKLITDGYKISLMILGEGSERELLQTYIDEHKLNENIKLLGFKVNPYKYIAQADLFVSSSHSEGFSLVIAEAMILNKPIISTRTCGTTELLDNGKYGYMVDDTFDSIYNGIKDVIDNDLLKTLSNKAKKGARKFNFKKSISEIDKIIMR